MFRTREFSPLCMFRTREFSPLCICRTRGISSLQFRQFSPLCICQKPDFSPLCTFWTSWIPTVLLQKKLQSTVQQIFKWKWIVNENLQPGFLIMLSTYQSGEDPNNLCVGSGSKKTISVPDPTFTWYILQKIRRIKNWGGGGWYRNIFNRLNFIT